MKLPVVTIKRGKSHVRINRAEYVPDMGEILDSDPPLTDDEVAALMGTAAPAPDTASTAAPAPDTASTAAPAPDTATGPVPSSVVKRNRKWYVTDAEGNEISADGIDSNGYSKESDAWNAILGVKNA